MKLQSVCIGHYLIKDNKNRIAKIRTKSEGAPCETLHNNLLNNPRNVCRILVILRCSHSCTVKLHNNLDHLHTISCSCSVENSVFYTFHIFLYPLSL